MAFHLFNHIDQLDRVTAQPAASDFYTLLAQLQSAVRTQSPGWAAYQTFVDYAQICFWAIRKHEYSFIAQSFAELEATSDHPLRVLDVGCGVVPMNNWMSRRGHQVIAFDPLRADVEFLVSNNLNGFYQSSVDYYQGRAEQLPFADATFDVVTCISVLEHITPGNDLLALWEMARVLKPGGHLLITFDVSPAAPESPGAAFDLAHRGFAEPFNAHTAAILFGQLAQVFEVSPNDLPDELAQLSWEDVYQVWRAVQAHDRREEAVRHYLAMGAVLQCRPTFKPLDPAQTVLQYMQGQTALERRASFFEYHAGERLKQIYQLTAMNDDLRQAVERAQAAAETAASDTPADSLAPADVPPPANPEPDGEIP